MEEFEDEKKTTLTSPQYQYMDPRSIRTKREMIEVTRNSNSVTFDWSKPFS